MRNFRTHYMRYLLKPKQTLSCLFASGDDLCLQNHLLFQKSGEPFQSINAFHHSPSGMKCRPPNVKLFNNWFPVLRHKLVPFARLFIDKMFPAKVPGKIKRFKVFIELCSFESIEKSYQCLTALPKIFIVSQNYSIVCSIPK